MTTAPQATGLAALAERIELWPIEKLRPYASYASTAGPGGLSALEDQQLAGLIMWVPAGLVYVGAALAALGACLREDGAGARRRGPLGAAG